MEKVYCSKCKYSRYDAGLCISPVDNYYAPDAPADVLMSRKNHKNDCKDFVKKEQ